MSSPQELERILPRIRRFAHATTADKELADLCVERALIRVANSIKSVEQFGHLLDERQLYSSVESELTNIAGDSFERLAWRALILVVVEDCGVFETGRILGMNPRRVRDIVATAEGQAPGDERPWNPIA